MWNHAIQEVAAGRPFYQGVGQERIEFRLLAADACGASASALLDLAEPVEGSEEELGSVLFDFGVLQNDTAAATRQLCWCPWGANCTSAENFGALAGELHVACPPGFYQLASQRCQECPPGSYCEGNQATAASCGHGSTSPRQAKTLQDCQCRRGFWNVSGSCEPCGIGSYTSATGAVACTFCPSGTTTITSGAIGVHECTCSDEWVDVDQAMEAFNCTPALFSDELPVTVGTGLVYRFNVSLNVSIELGSATNTSLLQAGPSLCLSLLLEARNLQA